MPFQKWLSFPIFKDRLWFFVWTFRHAFLGSVVYNNGYLTWETPHHWHCVKIMIRNLDLDYISGKTQFVLLTLLFPWPKIIVFIWNASREFLSFNLYLSICAIYSNSIVMFNFPKIQANLCKYYQKFARKIQSTKPDVSDVQFPQHRSSALCCRIYPLFKPIAEWQRHHLN